VNRLRKGIPLWTAGDRYRWQQGEVRDDAKA